MKSDIKKPFASLSTFLGEAVVTPIKPKAGAGAIVVDIYTKGGKRPWEYTPEGVDEPETIAQLIGCPVEVNGWYLSLTTNDMGHINAAVELMGGKKNIKGIQPRNGSMDAIKKNTPIDMKSRLEQIKSADKDFEGSVKDIKSMNIQMKVSDNFYATFADGKGNDDFEYSGYVPGFMAGENGDDYIDMDVDLKTGKITNWKKPSDKDIAGLKKDSIKRASNESANIPAKFEIAMGKLSTKASSKRIAILENSLRQLVTIMADKPSNMTDLKAWSSSMLGDVTHGIADNSDDSMSEKFSIKDEVLAGITFEELLDTVNANEPKKDSQAVMRTFDDINKRNMDDAKAILKREMSGILNSLK